LATITEWLGSLRLSEYAERFVENRIDPSVLPELTDEDLEKLGVFLGDRRKILRAIREQRSTPAGAGPDRTEAASERHGFRLFWWTFLPPVRVPSESRGGTHNRGFNPMALMQN
jgi:hypothetical protein